MKRYKAQKDVYCPHTGRLLFIGGYTYEEILVLGMGEIVLQTHPSCKVSRYTITGKHADLQGFFDVEVPETKFKRAFSNRNGGIGDLTIVADRFNEGIDEGGVDITFTSGYHNEEYKFFACMGASTSRDIGDYMYELAAWIEDGE
jgi:hypothetical protein